MLLSESVEHAVLEPGAADCEDNSEISDFIGK